MKRILPILICLSLFACLFNPATAVSAPEKTAVYAVPVEGYSVKRTGLIGGSVYPIDGYNLTGETADRLLPWDVEAATLSKTYTATLILSDMIQKLGSSSGFLIYISVPGKNTVAMTFELSTPEDSSRWTMSYAPELSPYEGSEYCLLADGSDKWTTDNFTATMPDSSYKAGISFDGPFSGYVKIPYSSLRNDSGFRFEPGLDSLEKVVFRFSRVGSDYGAVTAAPLFLVTGDGDAPQVVLPDEYRKAKVLPAVAFSAYNLNTGDLSCKEFAFGESGSVKAITLWAASGTPKNRILCYTGMDEPMDGTGGIILYVRTPAANDLTVSFVLNDPADASRKPFSYPAQMLLYAGTSLYTLASTGGGWQEKRVAVSGNGDNGSLYRGNICFDTAFEGYVALPYSAFRNDSGFILDTEQDSIFDLTVTISELDSNDGEIVLWGGLSGEFIDDTSDVKINRRFPIAADSAANGSIALSRSKAACGERVAVAVQPDNGYCLKPDGLCAEYTDFTGNIKSLIIEKADTDTRGAGEGKSFHFIMPAAQTVRVSAAFTPDGQDNLAMLEPQADGNGAIRFRMRFYPEPHDGAVTNAGMLITDSSPSENAVLNHSDMPQNTVDVPCSVVYDETSPSENGSKYTDFTLLLSDIREENKNDKYTVCGYVKTVKDGETVCIYTSSLTVSYDELADSVFDNLVCFGKPDDTIKSYYRISADFVESPVSEFSNAPAVRISTQDECNAGLTGLQDSVYWAGTKYTPVSLKGATDLMIYVSVPDSRENYLYLGFADQNGTEYKLWAERSYSLLERSEKAWRECRTRECKNTAYGCLELPAGFDGFVKIPLKSLYDANCLNANTGITDIFYRFSYIGTEENAVIAGPAFAVLGKNAPCRQTVYSSLNPATVSEKVNTAKTELYATGALFYWEAYNGAESYDITAYSKDKYGYVKAAEHTVYLNSGAVTGLCRETEYMIQISVRDSYGQCIGYYEPVTAVTAANDLPQAGQSSEVVYDTVDYSVNTSLNAAVSRTYTALSAENTYLLDGNPGRGLRGCMEFYHFNISDSELYKKLDGYVKASRFTTADCPVYVCYFYPGDYRGSDLDTVFFETVQKIFNYCRANKIQLLLRFAYYDVNNFNDRTPTTDELLSHIDQLAENGIIERNKDVLHAFQAGFIGRFGEWHSENEPVDRQSVLAAFTEKLLPDGVYSQVRMQSYKDFLTDSTLRRRFGIHIDSFFGIMDGSELGSGEFSYGYPQWDACVSEAACTPNDAELYYWNQFNSMGLYAEGYASVLGASRLRLNTLSGVNGYFDSGIYGDSCMSEWKKLPVTEQWLTFNGLPVTQGWLKNSENASVSRNVFEYIRDYLGYHLTVKSLDTAVSGNSLDVLLTLQNYGFSAAFNMKSSLVILDSDNTVISSIPAGNPEEWYCTDPNDYASRTLLTHRISCTVDMPQQPGNYSLALVLQSKSGAFARLDNKIPYQSGYNILHQFTIEQ